MLGKEWIREYFDDYIAWLENTLFSLLQKSNNEISAELINKELEVKGINSKDEFVEYFLQSQNKKRYPELAFLLDVNYIDNCEMNNFYFKLLEDGGKIVIDQEDKIKGLKLLLSEFLYQCGYDDALKIQNKLLKDNIEENRIIKMLNDKKVFNNVEVEYKNGTKENVTIFYGTLRGATTWYVKNLKNISKKIVKNKKGEYICGNGEDRIVICDKDIVEYIAKDYD